MTVLHRRSKTLIKPPKARLTGIITVVPSHLDFLETCIKDASDQTQSFDEVLVIASGFAKRELSRVSSIVAGFKLENMRVIPQKRASAGKNRNLGAREATGDILFFLDVDDRYHPQRNELIVDAMDKLGVQIVVHSFIAFDSSSQNNLEGWHRQPIIRHEIRDAIIRNHDLWTVPGRKRNRQKELLGAFSQIIDPESKLPLHHGHLSISSAAWSTGKVQHEEFFPRNEDSVYLRDKLEEGYEVGFIQLQLSGYRTDSSAGAHKKDWRGRQYLNVFFAFLKASLRWQR